ncbi:hypothetical protein C8A01DRAFT_51061 [Parachaetomium inaequale]|uniref:AB hydrolase-1 domain-containing protein n=1 Tax=Parachaetomium inaequale TaxID=2588326 RepID=A0AAN6SKT2_9PEZI|nr:hypothetical protein C8A01DRAFT_51061 [Parachaetomium inaequale]
MKPFTLTLTNDAKFKSLIVGLHGGSYSSAYFHVDEKHTAALDSNGLGVPWVAIDRPGYKGSTSSYPIPEGSSYHEILGDWLHRLILSALWQEFGKPQDCNSMVLLGHRLGTPGAVIAAAELSGEAEAGNPSSSPLSGIITSGFGTQAATISDKQPQRRRLTGVARAHPLPPEVKNAVMLPQGTCDPAIYAHTARLNEPFPAAEHDVALLTVFAARFRTEWAPRVRVPVMIGIAERDAWWKGDEKHVRDSAAAFRASHKVEGSVVRDAPHNLEMSYWAQAWYARCFGFGLECAVGFARAG